MKFDISYIFDALPRLLEGALITLQVAILGALRGLQDVKIPAFITFISYWIVGFPVSYYLGLYTSLESVGIWIGLFTGLFVASILLYIRFNYLSKKLILQSN